MRSDREASAALSISYMLPQVSRRYACRLPVFLPVLEARVPRRHVVVLDGELVLAAVSKRAGHPRRERRTQPGMSKMASKPGSGAERSNWSDDDGNGAVVALGSSAVSKACR